MEAHTASWVLSSGSPDRSSGWVAEARPGRAHAVLGEELSLRSAAGRQPSLLASIAALQPCVGFDPLQYMGFISLTFMCL